MDGKAVIFLFLFLTSALFAQDKIDFTANNLSGDKIFFKEMYERNFVLVNFWALWCKPCRMEMKSLKELHEKYYENGFQILGINQDNPRSVDKVESFVISSEIKYEIILDPNKEIFEMFNGQVLPLTILYDKEGKVVYRNQGYLPGDEFNLEKEIKKLLEIE